jgi:CysZ protein
VGARGNWLLTVLFSLVALGLAALLALGLAQPLSSFALFAIVQAQEERLTGYRVARAASADASFRGVWVTLVMIFLSVPIFLGLFLISLIFPPAALVTVPLKFLLCGWLLAWNFLDYPLGERGLGAGASLSWMGRHFGAVTAFGAAWALLVIVPGIVLVLLPMGVAGAARLVVEAEDAAAIDPDL